MKFLIFDAGPTISLTMNGLLPILKKLKKEFNGEFIITPDVKREVVDKPIKIKKYEWEGLQVNDLIKTGILSMSSKFIPDNKLKKKNSEILKLANRSFSTKAGSVELIQKGEASCLSFSRLCNSENAIVVDERTTRMLSEAPNNLKQIMERKLHSTININQKNIDKLKNFKFIRSSELLYIAYKKNLFEIEKSKQLLSALLNAVKFKGTAISLKEIDEIKKMI